VDLQLLRLGKSMQDGTSCSAPSMKLPTLSNLPRSV
jgi:hypothetical protein